MSSRQLEGGEETSSRLKSFDRAREVSGRRASDRRLKGNSVASGNMVLDGGQRISAKDRVSRTEADRSKETKLPNLVPQGSLTGEE